MDNLKSLMEQQNYELVIKLTANSTNNTELFYRVSALIALAKPVEALKVIETNQKIMEKDLKILLKIHIEILCILGKFDEAYEKYNYYSSLPYVNQETEEVIRAIPKYIRDEEKEYYSSKEISEDKLLDKLLSKDQNDVAAALDGIRSKDLSKFILPLQKVLTDFPKQSIRSLALFLLVEKKYNKLVKFKHFNDIVEVVPEDLYTPFQDDIFTSIVTRMNSEYKNTTISDTAIQLLSSYVIYIYPQEISLDINEALAVFYLIASKYLSITDYKEEDVCNMFNAPINNVKALIKSIEEMLNTF